jgi:hypothetical protein
MGYWDGKCFFCIFYGTLALIIGMSIKPIYSNIKKKNEKVIINNINVGISTDSTRSSNDINPL